MIGFRDHLKHATGDVQPLAKVVKEGKLSPNRKELLIDLLLKSKYHAAQMGILTDINSRK